MNSLLFSISPLYLGIGCICILLAIFISFIIVGVKKGFKNFGINFLLLILSLAGAIFLAKPLLSLFDKMFNFSGLFIEVFMLYFLKVPEMNIIINSTNLTSTVETFKSSDANISDILKNFLLSIFQDDKLVVENGTTTTLSAVASSTFSYLLALFIVALFVFVVLLVLTKVLLKLFIKSKKFENTTTASKVGGAAIGLVEGVIFGAIFLVILATFPIMGISNNYFGDAFEKTKVLNSTYQLVEKESAKIYTNSINWKKENTNDVGNYENLLKVKTYGDIDGLANYSDAKYDIVFTFANNSEVQVDLIYLKTEKIETKNFNYIFNNNKICLFDSENKIDSYHSINLNKKEITYNLNIVNEEKYSAKLKAFEENFETGSYKMSSHLQSGTEKITEAEKSIVISVVTGNLTLDGNVYKYYQVGNYIYCYNDTLKLNLVLGYDNTLKTLTYTKTADEIFVYKKTV